MHLKACLIVKSTALESSTGGPYEVFYNEYECEKASESCPTTVVLLQLRVRKIDDLHNKSLASLPCRVVFRRSAL